MSRPRAADGTADDITTVSAPERPGLVQLTPAAELRVLGRQPTLDAGERRRLEQRPKLLAWIGNGWHLVEFGIALGAGVAAGSVALVGFGPDSLIEVAAATVVIWLFSGGRSSSHAAERRAQRQSAISPARIAGRELGRDRLGCLHRADHAAAREG